MSLPANVISLRNLLAERFPEAHVARRQDGAAQAGIAGLDAAGWTAGSVVEVVGEKASAGAGVLLAALLAGGCQEVRRLVALVDGADAFDPVSHSPDVLERLLWVRCEQPEQAVRATDLLLRDGNLPWVLLDLQLQPLRALKRLPSHAWHRLRMLAEKSGVALCVFTPAPLIPSTQGRLVLEEHFSLESLDMRRAQLVECLHGTVVRGRARVVEGGSGWGRAVAC